jgi:hypothetical protein
MDHPETADQLEDLDREVRAFRASLPATSTATANGGLASRAAFCTMTIARRFARVTAL